MKTTHLFTAALVLTLGFATTAHAGSSALPEVLLTAISLGDNDAGQQPAVDDLLKRARQAMDEGNLEIAESFISRAEAQKPTYSPFHMGDTPKKARADLDKKRAAKTAPNQKPSAMFAPGGNGKSAAAKKSDGSTVEKNPFATRAANADNSTPTATPIGSGAAPVAVAPAATANSPLAADFHFPKGPDAGNPPAYDPAATVAFAAPNAPLNNSPWNNATETPAGRALTAQPPADAGGDIQWPAKHEASARTAEADPKAKSDELLRTARKALAVGDVRRATAMLEQAKQLKVEYPPLDNEPIKVENLIRKHNELTQSRTAQPTDTYKRQYSDLLLEQAQGMLRLGEADEAERLANDAQRLGLKYTPFETKPSNILDKVTATRNQGRPASTITFNNSAAAAGSDKPAGGLAPLPEVQSSTTARQEVQNVLAEARAAISTAPSSSSVKPRVGGSPTRPMVPRTIGRALFGWTFKRPGSGRPKIRLRRRRRIASCSQPMANPRRWKRPPLRRPRRSSRNTRPRARSSIRPMTGRAIGRRQAMTPPGCRSTLTCA